MNLSNTNKQLKQIRSDFAVHRAGAHRTYSMLEIRILHDMLKNAREIERAIERTLVSDEIESIMR